VEIETVRLVKEIIERLEMEEVEDGECVPAAYIRNSDEIDNLFQAILSVSPDGKIFSGNRKANELKALLMGIYLEQFPYHVS
jgi:hypothetical protein